MIVYLVAGIELPSVVRSNQYGVLFIENKVLAGKETEVYIVDILSASRKIVDIIEIFCIEIRTCAPVVGIPARSPHILELAAESAHAVVGTDALADYNPLVYVEIIISLLYIVDTVYASVCIFQIKEEGIFIGRCITCIQPYGITLVYCSADHLGIGIAVGDILNLSRIVSSQKQLELRCFEGILQSSAHHVGIVYPEIVAVQRAQLRFEEETGKVHYIDRRIDQMIHDIGRSILPSGMVGIICSQRMFV